MAKGKCHYFVPHGLDCDSPATWVGVHGQKLGTDDVKYTTDYNVLLPAVPTIEAITLGTHKTIGRIGLPGHCTAHIFCSLRAKLQLCFGIFARPLGVLLSLLLLFEKALESWATAWPATSSRGAGT